MILTNASPNYGVSKAAQIKLTKEMAIKFMNNGIRVNCISFGGVEGELVTNS